MTAIVDAILSGFIAALASVLPLSPEGEPFSSLVSDYSYLLVPAYLGVAFAIFFYFRDEFSRQCLQAMRGIYKPSLKFVAFASLFTVLLGYPLWRFSLNLPGEVSAIINALSGGLIVLYSLRPNLNPLKGPDGKLPEEPSMVDSLSAGLAGGVAVLGSLSRTGLVLPALIIPSHKPRKAVEWALWVAPAYILLKLTLISWNSSGDVWIPFTAFLSAFITSLLVIHLLLVLAERRGRGLLVTLGLISVVVYSLEVLI
ncbi:undecaprenyl-diphosphate phosphatase [Thermococcus sp.]|uniref:undecaprenyl-diphosphate phosphatase n=1 Tax=Thermococcus sp. TaxID=35749 RepID=UPI00262B82C2|nr:undecaprenyl-diphosphate phosphatase [Thermococcus sp.]